MTLHLLPAAPARSTVAYRAREAPAPRLRPGERGVYVPLAVDGATRRHLREVALVRGVAVDAQVAAALEWLYVERLLHRAGRSTARIAPRTSATVVGLPPSPAWRAWVDALSGGGAKLTDELPEVLLPERLVPRLRDIGDAVVVSATSGEACERALALEISASTAGMTLTEWVLAGALGI